MLIADATNLGGRQEIPYDSIKTMGYVNKVIVHLSGQRYIFKVLETKLFGKAPLK